MAPVGLGQNRVPLLIQRIKIVLPFGDLASSRSPNFDVEMISCG